MEDTAIQPTLLFSILCDDIRQENNGKFILIGLFETIGATKFPAQHPTLFIMNCWSSGIGTFAQRSRILNPDGSILAQDQEVTFTLPDLKAKHRIIARFNNLCFEKEGEYSIEVILSQELKVRYPLIVELINKKGN